MRHVLHNKEEPNTKNVQTWLDTTSNNEDRSARKQKPSTPAVSWFDRARMQMEKMEYFIFLFVGSILWICVVRIALKWLQFPIHLHKVEVSLTYCIPILLLLALLSIVEYSVGRDTGKEKIHNI